MHALLKHTTTALSSPVYWATRSLATQRLSNTRRPFVPSAEQQAIVELSRTQNVVVSARPGAGKTATAEAIVAANPDRPIAVITYSKRLQLETAGRLHEYPGCDVYTFHGMAGKLYSSLVYNDSILRSLRRQGARPAWTGQPYQVVVLDELQDCTEELFWLTYSFISSITHAAGRAPQIVALGDERQAIYGFRGADARFLSLASSTMSALSPYPWTHLPLSKSFRLSHQTANFVNEVFLGGETYMTGSHDGPKPIYMHGNLQMVQQFGPKVVSLIQFYGPERTAIISPSIRTNSMLALFTNYLSEKHKIKVAVSISDDTPLDDLVISGKVSVSTYHQFKGNERDLVIVYGVDAAYFKFIARNLPDDTCPNATFVALTRASKQLLILHNENEPPMPFMDIGKLYTAGRFINLSRAPMKPSNPIGRPLQLGLLLPTRISVSEMARHVPDEMLESIVNAHLNVDKVASPLPSSQHIEAPDKALTDPVKMHYEAVSDLNGLAVVAAYEYASCGTLATFGYGLSGTPTIPSDVEEQAAWLCREACVYEGRVSGYRSRSIQMKDHTFDWLGPYVDAARERLKEQFQDAKKLNFEVLVREKRFGVKDSEKECLQMTELFGRADIVRYDGKSGEGSRKWIFKVIPAKISSEEVSIWEIKFVAKLCLEHAVQAAVYAYLWSINHKQTSLPRIILFNVRDGEKWEMTARDGIEGMKRMTEEILRAKYSTREAEPTDVFLKKCAKVREEVEGISADA